MFSTREEFGDNVEIWSDVAGSRQEVLKISRTRKRKHLSNMNRSAVTVINADTVKETSTRLTEARFSCEEEDSPVLFHEIP